ncbi:MAG: TetR/AcrR family transcriptional regulator [Anaerolineae bacterium]|nr:TetR/AcrR family transcriptional regulator [Anaerolineae bacterium]
MRKQPRQLRSQQRVDAILNAAAQLFAENGYEAVTTNAIAAKAGVAIGSLYQFFPNKEAIIEAMVQHYAGGMRELLVYDPSRPAVEVIDQFVDNMAAFEAAHLGFRPLFMTHGMATSMHEEIIQQVYDLMTYYFPRLSHVQVQQGATVMVALVKGVMPLMIPPDNLPSEQVILELKTVLRGYLRALLVRLDQPLPPELV